MGEHYDFLTVWGIIGRLQVVNNASKTSNSHSSAYTGTVECELRSKSKCLRSKFFSSCFRIFANSYFPINANQRGARKWDTPF